LEIFVNSLFVALSKFFLLKNASKALSALSVDFASLSNTTANFSALAFNVSEASAAALAAYIASRLTSCSLPSLSL
jgi:hypothetical protein